MNSLLSTVWTVLVPLLDETPAPEDVKPGWIALILVLLLGLATVALWMNMRKQIRKIKFDDGSTPPSEETSGADAPDPS